MAYRITITDLDTNEIKCEQETDTFVVVIDEGDHIATRGNISCDSNTLANLAEVLCMESEHVLSKLPEGLRKVASKVIRKDIKQAAKKR